MQLIAVLYFLKSRSSEVSLGGNGFEMITYFSCHTSKYAYVLKYSSVMSEVTKVF